MSAVKRASSSLMETLANLALRKPLHAMEEMCETQNQVSMARLGNLIVLAGGELADYAHTLRQDYDALAAKAIEQRCTPLVHPLYRHPPAPAVPEGWQLVPVEPTPEMLSATTTSRNPALRAEIMHMAAEDWAKMLAAAPPHQ